MIKYKVEALDDDNELIMADVSIAEEKRNEYVQNGFLQIVLSAIVSDRYSRAFDVIKIQREPENERSESDS